MLDLSAVKHQVDQMVAEERVSQHDFRLKFEIAQQQLLRWRDEWAVLARKIERSRTSWLMPRIFGPLDQCFDKPPRPERISVAATDGSQIFPDRHEIAACYLINIGYILLHYGTGEKPLMSSKPSLYFKEDELFESLGGRRQFANREMVGFRRGLMEFTELADLALAADAEGYPVIALSDGTLIMWNLEAKPQDFKKQYMATMLESFTALQQKGIPVAGYISQPGSQEVVNALKLGMCPQAAADCDRCPWKSENQFGLDADEIEALRADLWQGDSLPCSPLDGLSDGVLMRQILKPGQRSGIFASTSKILQEYGEHGIHFFYVHAGEEVARVEIPAWVATDPKLLDQVHACVCDQAEKGQGYPVSLSEAHERAVVRGADREAFFRFLQDMFIKNDIRTQISNKSFKKRYASI